MDTQTQTNELQPSAPYDLPCDVKLKVDAIFVGQFELDAAKVIPAASLFTDLGLDSLDAIDLMITFEREFGFKPETAELQSIRTVDDVYRLVGRYLEAGTAASARPA